MSEVKNTVMLENVVNGHKSYFICPNNISLADAYKSLSDFRDYMAGRIVEIEEAEKAKQQAEKVESIPEQEAQ